MENISLLTNAIIDIHNFFQAYAYRQINNSLTFQNWMIGFYIVEYEQNGNDRAVYGEKTLSVLSEKLQVFGIKGFSDRNLRLCRQFFIEYPEIWQIITSKFQRLDTQIFQIWQTSSAKTEIMRCKSNSNHGFSIEQLIDKISFSHFVELMKVTNQFARKFYEIELVKNNWSVKLLHKNISTLLFERVGVSKNSDSLIGKYNDDNLQNINDFIKNPYILDFLNFPEKTEFSETDLEQAIIDHLQKFLTELGRGFCFEARQKRITFNNRHFRIDLVFYHRILKCHVLIDIKVGEFDHADVGQMNLYLNYYQEIESSNGDNKPVGIILCSQKDDTLVHFATGNLSHEIFVSRYLLHLPSEEELRFLIDEELRNYSQ